LKKAGHELLVISTHGKPEIKTIDVEGVSVVLFPFLLALWDKNLLLIKKIVSGLHKVIDNFGPDVINIHGWFEGFSFFQALVLENKNIPFCLTLHGSQQIHYQTPACLKIWNLAQAINSVSYSMLESPEFKSIKSLGRSKLRVIYNGLAWPTQLEQPLVMDPPVLLMIGRCTEQKGFDIGLSALKLLIDKYPNIKMILAGDGDRLPALRALSEQLGLNQTVSMVGFVPPNQVSDYFDKASVVLMPSRFEPFGLVALEAAMRARPIVASAIEGLTEVIVHEETGLLVESENPRLLAEAVDNLLSHPEKAEAMGKAAQKRARELFTVEKMAQAYLSMYQEVISQQINIQENISQDHISQEIVERLDV